MDRIFRTNFFEKALLGMIKIAKFKINDVNE